MGPETVGTSGGADAAEQLYRSTRHAMVRLAYLMLGSDSDAEDAFHQAFLRCSPRLDTIENPPAYLRVAVVNECRRLARRTAPSIETIPERSVLDIPIELLDLRAALDRLSPRRRAVIVLRYFEDLPDAEIAGILRCRRATVRSLARRALRQLQEVLA